MTERYERKAERKFCYFIKGYVEPVFNVHRWMLADGSWQQEEKGFECPRARRCRKDEHNCIAIHPESGTDPFIPFRDLLADMW
jgi:hypothetical protein